MTEAISSYSKPLKGALERKQLKNPRYSLAALARDMDLSTSYVSRVLSGKKLPSAKFLRKVQEALCLTPNELHQIYLSVCFESLPTQKCQQFFLEKIIASPKEFNPSDFLILEDESFAILTKWQMMAILQLTSLTDFKSDPTWIAKRLNTTLTDVTESLAVLFHHEFLKNNAGQFISTHKRIAFNSSRANLHFTKYQQQMIGRQLNDLEQFSEGAEERCLSSLTVATTPEKAKAIEEYIRNVAEDSFEKLKTSQPTEVYQLNIGLIPLTGRTS